MERLTMSYMKNKLAELQERAARHHAERMAGLPPGTCERCYGTNFLPSGGNCFDCNPIEVIARGVPYEFRDARFANYRSDEGNQVALSRAKAFFDGTLDLYLTGGVGAGKSRLACSIANEAQKRGISTWFVRVPMILHQLQPSGDLDEIRELESMLFNQPLLVLDDVGAERDQATDYTRRTLLMIYEERGDRGKRTIWTSNKSLQELGTMQDDDRLASRIAGRAIVVRMTTPDQRLRRVK